LGVARLAFNILVIDHAFEHIVGAQAFSNAEKHQHGHDFDRFVV
jgi:hypothetical protein